MFNYLQKIYWFNSLFGKQIQSKGPWGAIKTAVSYVKAKIVKK